MLYYMPSQKVQLAKLCSVLSKAGMVVVLEVVESTSQLLPAYGRYPACWPSPESPACALALSRLPAWARGYNKTYTYPTDPPGCSSVVSGLAEELNALGDQPFSPNGATTSMGSN